MLPPCVQLCRASLAVQRTELRTVSLLTRSARRQRPRRRRLGRPSRRWRPCCPPVRPLRLFQPPHPQAQAQAQAHAQAPEREGERVQVSLAQVPRWQGSKATHNRRDHRHYGGNKRGRERRMLRGFAEPAAAAAAADGAAPPLMLREGSNGAAPRRRPWPGREGPPGQRRRVAVMSPPAPPSRAPSAAGYAADKSSVQGSSVWSDFFSPGSP